MRCTHRAIPNEPADLMQYPARVYADDAGVRARALARPGLRAELFVAAVCARVCVRIGACVRARACGLTCSATCHGTRRTWHALQ
jgi:hypothetical protein